MKRSAAFFPIALALGAIMLAPWASTQAQDSREEGPIEIDKCQTINQPGSYRLVNNLTFKGSTGVCLQITADFVTIDLAGFTISGPALVVVFGPNTTAIAAGNDTTGIAVRNGSISGFGFGVTLGGDGSIVEGLRVFGRGTALTGIAATGIVKGNTVVGIANADGVEAVGISATGIVTGNYALNNRIRGLLIGQGSTVIGNTASGTVDGPGIEVACPSNVTDNTAVNNFLENLTLGNGCNNTNNVAP
jgi:hypothetical protein